MKLNSKSSLPEKLPVALAGANFPVKAAAGSVADLPLPSVTAGRLCPKGVFIPPRMGYYRQESAKIMETVARMGATLEQVSIDEAYQGRVSRPPAQVP